MKFLYITLAVLILLVAGYMIIYDFNFDNISFSNYLISALVILLTSCITVGGIAWLLAAKRKNHYKGIMTIRQYYDYKSAR